MHPFRLPSQYGRSRTLASRPSVPRASANDAFSLVYASSSLTRIVSRRRQLVASISAIIFVISRSSTVIFSKSNKKRSVTRVCLTCSPRRLHGDLPQSRLTQVPWQLRHSRRSFLRSVPSSHWRSPLQCSRSLASGR